MSQLDQLQARFQSNALELNELRKRVEQIELEQHRIGIAIEVITAVNAGTAIVTPPPLALVAAGSASPSGSSALLQKQTVKQLILSELTKISQLTKMDLVSRLTTAGHDVNSGTVGTTLSKMVGREIEKAGPYAYRLKGENPGATGFSSATELGGSQS